MLKILVQVAMRRENLGFAMGAAMALAVTAFQTNEVYQGLIVVFVLLVGFPAIKKYGN